MRKTDRLARGQRVRQRILGSGELHGAREAVVGVSLRDAAAVLEEDVLRDAEGERLGRVQQLAAREPLQDAQQRLLREVPGVVFRAHAARKEEAPQLLRQASDLGLERVEKARRAHPDTRREASRLIGGILAPKSRGQRAFRHERKTLDARRKLNEYSHV